MAPPSGGEKLLARRKMGCGGIGQQSGDGHTHERVERIPDQVKGRNFVGKKFDDEQDSVGRDDPPVLQQMELSGERQQTRMRQQAQGSESRINIQASGKAGCNQQGHEFIGGESHLLKHKGRIGQT
jgi:hypothetical protein